MPLRGALSAALLIGVAQHAAVAHEAGEHDSAPGATQAEPGIDKTAIAVEQAEAAVARAPQDAALRAGLGRAYLRAGRFVSAAAALGDAMALGHGTDHIVLSLALAQIASGQNRAALATLDHATNIAPADLGLALALAGDPGHGIAVLTDAVHNGPVSANLRQNLAYAYALDGRWADASLTAGFDLPPDQVNIRLQQWAETMQSGGERTRIARLLNVPLVADPGVPAGLALAQAHPDPAPAAPVAVAVPVPIPIVVIAADPVPAPAAITMIAVPVVQQIAVAPEPASARQLAVRSQGASPGAQHFVQLAAYHNQRDAERGRLILAKRHALLRGHGLLITQARLHGRSYWQVVIAGFDGSTAASMCTSLKRQGAACFAYSSKAGHADMALALASVPASKR